MLEFNIATLVGLLFASAFFSGVETALVSVDRYRARQLMKRSPKAGKLMEDFQASPQRLLTTILIGNNIVNIAASAIATTVAIQLFDSNALGIAVGVMTFLVLVFGEITPKTIAVQNAEAISLIVIRPLNFLAFLLSPVIWFLNGIGRLVMRVIGVSDEQQLTEQDVRTMVTIGAEEGAIHETEREMIQRIFQFDDIEAEKIMTPRSRIKMLPAETRLEDIKEFLSETPYSRIPVFKGTPDKIVGVFYVKDAWKYFAQGKLSTKIEALIRPALFVPRTKTINKLLEQFQSKHTHLAVVVDEYGGVMGIITLEDLLEEIVGDIVDESDIEPWIRKIDQNTYEVSGRITLDKANKMLRTKWASERFDTLGGFMIEKLDKLPDENEEVAVGNFILIATKVKNPRILRIRIVKKK